MFPANLTSSYCGVVRVIFLLVFRQFSNSAGIGIGLRGYFILKQWINHNEAGDAATFEGPPAGQEEQQLVADVRSPTGNNPSRKCLSQEEMVEGNQLARRRRLRWYLNGAETVAATEMRRVVEPCAESAQCRRWSLPD